MLAFHIGGENEEYVQASILRDNKDGWFSGAVTISVGAFRGEFTADFNSWAFSDFLSQLENVYSSVSGTAIFTTYEKQLELSLNCDFSGHIQVFGEARDVAGTGNKLNFQLTIDQTYLPKIISNLQSALKEYPPRAV